MALQLARRTTRADHSKEPTTVSTIYHITTAAAWEAAQAAGAYRADSLAREGFIHLSTGAQLLRTASRFYAGQAGLLLLAVDEGRLAAELRYEEGEPGELFPHLYGPLNLDAVVGAHPFPPERDGTFRMPEEMKRP
jgi:uncharacterized protein (DUF952 family)